MGLRLVRMEIEDLEQAGGSGTREKPARLPGGPKGKGESDAGGPRDAVKSRLEPASGLGRPRPFEPVFPN